MIYFFVLVSISVNIWLAVSIYSTNARICVTYIVNRKVSESRIESKDFYNLVHPIQYHQNYRTHDAND